MLWTALVLANVSVIVGLRWLRFPFGFSIGPLFVIFLVLADDSHLVHKALDAALGSALEHALIGIARVGGWDENEHGQAPYGVIPKIDLATSLLRDIDINVMSKNFLHATRSNSSFLAAASASEPEELECEIDQLVFWDRLGADMSAAVYSREQASSWMQALVSRVRVSSDSDVSLIQVDSSATRMPVECASNHAACWQFIEIGSTNAALLVRFGSFVGVSHRGTQFSSIRDMLGALRTTLTPALTATISGGRVHSGWACLREIQSLVKTVHSWTLNATDALSTGHSKGGSRSQHFALAMSELHLISQAVDRTESVTVESVNRALYWHTRSFSSPKWAEQVNPFESDSESQPPRAGPASSIEHLAHQKEQRHNLNAPRHEILSSVNYYIEYDPIYVGFELLGFESQLATTTDQIAGKVPPDIGVFGWAIWVFRAHFLSSVAEHIFGEKTPQSQFKTKLEQGFYRLALLCISLLTLLAAAALKMYVGPVVDEFNLKFKLWDGLFLDKVLLLVPDLNTKKAQRSVSLVTGSSERVFSPAKWAWLNLKNLKTSTKESTQKWMTQKQKPFWGVY